MTLSVLFALLALLLLGLDEGSVHPASANVVEITLGSVIKLMHERANCRLHSHDVPYGSGSGRQSVTGSPDVDDSNSCWVSCFGGDYRSDTGDFCVLRSRAVGKHEGRQNKASTIVKFIYNFFHR